MPTISEAFAIAVSHHQAGNLELAEQVCRRILVAEPNHADALHLLGVIAHQTGQYDAAVDHIGRAIRIRPAVAEYYNNLGNALQAQGNLDDAIACYQRGLELQPDLTEAHNGLGNSLALQGKLDEAVSCYRRALELAPGYANAWANLGNVFRRQRRVAEAIGCYRRALDLQPDCAEAHYSLGVTLQEQADFVEAAFCFQRALQLNPEYPEAINNLGRALQAQGRVEEALTCYRRVLEVMPDIAEVHANVGKALADQGKLEEAITCYRRAIELEPEFAEAHGSLLHALHFFPNATAQSLYEEHLRWNRCHAKPLAKLIKSHMNDRSSDRRLRVGYVSPDFCAHPVGRFLLPLLESHDHLGFEIFCYASVPLPDATTERFRASADVWRNAFALSDEQLADLIRGDRIDILVDLTMHTAHSRLLVFARKPAPIQVTYLAYCSTTGLDAIDYRLTDPYFDPPGRDESFYTEKSIRLPATYWCYRPVADTPCVSSLPAAESGHVSFGCLNNFCKVSARALATWSQLLTALPESRLLLHAHPGSHRERVYEFFGKQGITRERVEFVAFLPTAEYFQTYQRVDVALDPFPYGGGATTCDALWMGVPVVSLAGQTAVGRAGLSILSNVGLPELVARDTEEYVRIATGLANDLPRLANLRATLRERMQQSPLMDAPRFARNVEAAYRWMWHRWCDSR